MKEEESDEDNKQERKNSESEEESDERQWQDSRVRRLQGHHQVKAQVLGVQVTHPGNGFRLRDKADEPWS